MKLQYSTRLGIITFITIVFIALFSCRSGDLEKAKQSIIQADTDFSALSQAEGMNHAFLSYMDKEGTILQDNSMPIIGRETFRELIQNRNDSAFKLTWEPLFADVSRSGDLGYTYGIYSLQIDTVVQKGTYVSIWKKNEEGEWKFVLDTGNEGLE